MHTFAIEREKVREFALATRSTSEDRDTERPVIPPTFLTTAALMWAPEEEADAVDLDFEWARVLHGEEEYVFHGPPPRAGEVLQVACRLEARYDGEDRRGGVVRVAEVVHEFRDDAGTLVAEQCTTVVETAPGTEAG